MGVLFGLLSLLAIGGVFAVQNDTASQAYGPGYGREYGLNDGSGYGRGRGMMGSGFANGGNFENCPMHEALEAQGVTDEEFAQWHAELIENGRMGPLAMRSLLEEKGIDTSDFPAIGSRRAQR